MCVESQGRDGSLTWGRESCGTTESRVRQLGIVLGDWELREVARDRARRLGVARGDWESCEAIESREGRLGIALDDWESREATGNDVR